MSLKDKILGGLYGQALGDAWGMPAYFDIDHTWEVYGGWITELKPGPPDHPVHFGLPAGRITDDSEQAGVQALKRGEDPHTTGTWGDTNGAAMRISPVGLLHPGDVNGAINDAATVCIPTHNTNVAISGACAVAAAIAVGAGENATLDAVVAAGLLGAHLGRQKGGRWMGPSVARRIEMAVAIAREPREPLARLREIADVVGTTLSVPETVGAAFGVLIMAEGDPQQAAIYAANLSGDADTVGAIACAMAGAYAGINAFDPAILARLDADEVTASYRIRDIAEGLYALATA